MYLCSRSRIRVRVRPKAFFTGQHTLLMNHAFSARRLARFRENIRHSAHSTMAVDRVDQNQVRHLIPLDEQTHHVDDNGRPDGDQSQPISAVAAVHEPGHSVADPLEETHTLASFL